MKTELIRKSILSIFFLFIATGGKAQTVQWARKGSSQGFDNGNGIAVDDSGNVYAGGQIEYTAAFDQYSVSSYGIHDIIAVKYDKDGNIKWIHGAGGRGGDVCNALAIDGAHNTYLAGEVEDTANFGSGISVISSGSNDIFLAKYNVGGNISWVKRWGTSSNDKALGIATNPSGECFITGYYSANINFGGTNLSNSGSGDMFLVKTNSSGTVQWAKKGAGSREDRGYGVALDPSGNVFVTGSFGQSASFSGTSISSSGRQSAYLAKYNSSGTVQWVRAAGACCDTTKSYAVATDDNGNSYIAGYFNVSTNFGSTHLTSAGGYDVFVAKYDPSGNLLWAKRAGGNAEDIAYGITVDNTNDVVYVTGSLQSSTGSFDSHSFSVVGYKDVFVAAYDLSGNVIWVKTNGGHHRDVGSAIAVSPLGYIYVTGLFNGEADFDANHLSGYLNQPWADFLVDKITAQPVNGASTSASSLSVTPGNCSDLQLNFVPGDGSRRIIIARQGSAVNQEPNDGYMYSANSNFGSGSNLGSNNYVVYDGTGNSATITGLTPGSTYYFSIIEYNGTGATINYRNSSPATGNATAPNFTINISGLQSAICIGESLSLQATGASTYSWLPLSGLSTGSGPNVIASPGTTTDYTISATTAAGCPAVKTFTIVVNPLPEVHFPNLNAVCDNDPPITLSTGTPPGGTYSGPGVSGGIFTPATAGAGNFTLQYEYTDGNGCTDINPASIVVDPSPAVSITALPASCEYDAPITLNNGSPSGGDYSGLGVSSGEFDPSVGPGVYTINYTYENSSGCSASASVFQVVSTLPSIDLGSDRLICGNHTIVIDAGPGFDSYDWNNGATSASIQVDSSGTGLGTRTIIVEVSNSVGCLNSDTIEVTFDLCAGIGSLEEDGIFSLYPNPFAGSFNLKAGRNINLAVYDACGQILERIENVHGSFYAGEKLAPGIYFVEVTTGTFRKVIAVVKTN